MALAKLKITEEVFLDLVPREFIEALRINDEFEVHKVKATVRPICEAIRMEAFYLVNVQLPRNKQHRNPTKLMRFVWDGEEVRKPQSVKEMKAVMKFIAKEFRKKKDKPKRRK